MSTPIYDTLAKSTDYKPVCEAFWWIGQGFDHCERCGRPYWLHTHEDRGRDKEPLLITPELAEQCRAKWERKT